MTLTLKIDGAYRAATLKEVHALCAGDVYNPLVLDFSSLGREAASRIGANLALIVRAVGPEGPVVASVPAFERDPTRWAFWRSSLVFVSEGLQTWLGDAGGPCTATGWLEVSDGSVSYVSCAVPVALRDAPPQTGMVYHPTVDQVRDMIAEAGAAGGILLDDVPVQGSPNAVKSSGLYDALALKADLAAVQSMLSGYVTSGSLQAALSGYVTSVFLQATLSGYVTSQAVQTMLSGYVTSQGLTSALSSYVTEARVTELIGLIDPNTLFPGVGDLAARLSSLDSAAGALDVRVTALEAGGGGGGVGADVLARITALETGKADMSAVYTKAEVEALIADIDLTALSVYTKAETDALLNARALATDVYTKLEVEALVTGIGSSVYTKAEADALLGTKADVANVYTKTEVQDLIADIGSSVYTKAETDALLNARALASNVYTKTEVFTKAEVQALVTGIGQNMYTKAEADALLGARALASSVYTKTEVQDLIAGINRSVYTKTEADALLGNKADAASVYTKAETDALLGSGGAGMPAVTVPDPDGLRIPQTVQLPALAFVKAVTVRNGAPVEILVKGVDVPVNGVVCLTETNGWSATFAGGGTCVADVVGGRNYVTIALSDDQGTPLASLNVDITGGGYGMQAPSVADDEPVEGSSRLITSGGVAAAVAALAQNGNVYTKGEADATFTSLALHTEDLEATRLVTAQNATSSAAAARAAAKNLRLILDIEARLDGATT